MPFFSVVIPCYNSELTISKCLDSITNQTFSGYEVLIMDGLSKDNTVNIVKGCNNERIKIFSEADFGIYDAMNKGIDKATGDWLYFLGSDDYLYDNNVLSDVYNKLLANNIDLLYGNSFFSVSKRKYDGEFDVEKLLLKRKNICHQSIFYSKEIFLKIGFFNTNYRLLADYDLNLKIFLKKEFRIYFFDRIIAVFYDGAASTNNRDMLFEKDLVENYVLHEYSAYEIYLKMLSKSRSLDSINKINKERSALSHLKAALKKISQGRLW